MTESDIPADVLFLHRLMAQNGYTHARPIGGGRYACVAPFMFTTAIIVGRIGDYAGFDDRWCYHSVSEAALALQFWDGTGEPAGWHRQPGTGRRLAETEGCVDDDGNVVPIGTIYVRL